MYRKNCKEREFLCISHPASLIANVLITMVACQTKEPNMAALLTIPQTLFRHPHCFLPSCPVSVPGSHPAPRTVFSHPSSSASSHLGQFLSLSLSFVTLTVLRDTTQVFRRIPPLGCVCCFLLRLRFWFGGEMTTEVTCLLVPSCQGVCCHHDTRDANLGHW